LTHITLPDAPTRYTLVVNSLTIINEVIMPIAVILYLHREYRKIKLNTVYLMLYKPTLKNSTN